MEQAAPLLLGGKAIQPWPARPGSAEIPGATGTAAAAAAKDPRCRRDRSPRRHRRLF